jgi:hypothetical protein
METIKANYKAYFMRKYLVEKGVMTELGDITSLNEEGNPAIDMPAVTEEHFTSMIRSMLPTVAVLNTIKRKMDKATEELGFLPPEEVQAPSDSGGGNNFGGGDEFGGDQFGGGDQFDMGQTELQGQTQGQATQQQAPVQQQAPEEPDETVRCN